MGKPTFDKVGNKTRQIIPMEYFDAFENGFYERVESPFECDELCVNEFNGVCNAFVFNTRKFTCQLGIGKCNIFDFSNNDGKLTFKGSCLCSHYCTFYTHTFN